MKLNLKLGNRVFHFATFKTRAAYGIKSLNKNGSHYLLMDFDIKDKLAIDAIVKNLQLRKLRPFVAYYTKNGFHVIVLKEFDFFQALMEMIETPFIDLNHVAIGMKRKYWFLETSKRLPTFLALVGFKDKVSPMVMQRA